MLGDSGVGKTSLIRRFVIDEFHDHYIETIGTKISRKDIEMDINGKEYSLNLQIWDLLGQKTYSSVQSRAFVGMDGALIVADITREETLASIENYWLPTLTKVVVDPQFVFLANKMDLRGNTPDLDNLEKISSKYDFAGVDNSFLTSAKTGENVENVFLTMARMILLFQKPADPTREIFEELLAESVYMDRDKTTLVGVTDAVITEFCRLYGDEDKGMEVLREQLVKAGVEISKPHKAGLVKAIEYLAEELSSLMDTEEIKGQKEKWLRMVAEAKDDG